MTETTQPSPIIAPILTTERILWQGFFLCFAFLPITFLAFLEETRELNGINLWIKPLKFQVSVLIHLGTLAVLARLIHPSVREHIATRAMATLVSAFAVFEIIYITIQAGRGRHSHFNLETAFEAKMYSLMGMGAVGLILGAAIIGILIFWRPNQGVQPGLRLGSLLGLTLGFAATLIVAGYLGGNGGHWVGGTPNDTQGLPIVGWSQNGGDLRVPHFFATHMMQAIPIVGWLADRNSAHATRWVYAASALGVALVAATFAQALAGMPLF